ncbi:threonine dehydratase, partial [Paraburkholderia bannensis]|nr:threonine dehydratase [Paraburkholderia sp. WP4_3_2]MBB6107146.1 threonine dehydratase [Paraburkholderia bannensis]
MQVQSSRTAAEAETCAETLPAQQTDYLRLILTARVYDAARETELERAPNLSTRLRNTVLLKR